MPPPPPWVAILLATVFLLHGCGGERCGKNPPSVWQVQAVSGNPPKFTVEIKNNCPMCPVIDVHINCGGFYQALVSPRQFKVVANNDCVVNGGLPLAPLQKLYFNYTHNKFLMSPKSWYFQCE